MRNKNSLAKPQEIVPLRFFHFKLKMINNDDSAIFSEYKNNFWTECPRLSDGCKFCSLVETTEIKNISDETINKPKKIAGRKTIFTCCYSDFFVPHSNELKDDAWKVIRAIPQHIWIIITHRYNIKQQGISPRCFR